MTANEFKFSTRCRTQLTVAVVARNGWGGWLTSARAHAFTPTKAASGSAMQLCLGEQQLLAAVAAAAGGLLWQHN